MFDNLTGKLQDALKKLRGQAVLTEANIAESMKEIRDALIDADVNLEIADEFIATVRQTCLGVKPDMHIKLLSDALAFDPTVKITVKLPDGRPEKLKGAKSVTITMPTVLSTHRREMGAALVEALKAAAHKAREIASDTYALWRSALSVAIGRDFGGEGLASGEAKKFATLLDNANTNLYLDCEIAAYSTGKEASDVL